MRCTLILAIVALLCPTTTTPAQATAPKQESTANPADAIDALFAHRFSPPNARRAASRALAATLRASGLDVGATEALIRRGRVRLEPIPDAEQVVHGQPPRKLLPLLCDHVDYATGYLLYVPKSYDPKQPSALVTVAHGGNSAMRRQRAIQAALGGMMVWRAEAEKHRWILAAPLTSRGWMRIGNSIAFSLIAKLQRRYRIDPDRIYVTGHSMGGHMTWRTALGFPDRFAAVAPMSGGYDFVKRKQIQRLFNIPGYATWCAREPYGIDRDNETNATWLKTHGYDWVCSQGPGSHTIPRPELPKIAAFFVAHRRDLYPEQVYTQKAGSLQIDAAPDAAASKRLRWTSTADWKGPHTWNPDRPLRVATAYWIRCVPREPAFRMVPDGETGKEKKQNILQSVWADNRGENRIELTTENVRDLEIYLHPRMVDFTKPVTVVANGETVFQDVVRPDLATLLDTAVEFDDRGRLFHAKIRVAIATDRPVPIPGSDQPAAATPAPGPGDRKKSGLR